MLGRAPLTHASHHRPTLVHLSRLRVFLILIHSRFRRFSMCVSAVSGVSLECSSVRGVQNPTVYAGKMGFLVEISIQLFLKSYGEPYGEFPHNCAKNDRQELKNGLCRCVSTSATIYAQNQGLNRILAKVWQFQICQAVFRFDCILFLKVEPEKSTRVLLFCLH